MGEMVIEFSSEKDDSAIPISDTQLYDAILKLTGSLQIELVPGSENYLDLKAFAWAIEVAEGDKSIKLRVKFDSPSHISIGEQPDSLLVNFRNAELWMKPKDT